MPKSRVVIIEGIYALSHKIRSFSPPLPPPCTPPRAYPSESRVIPVLKQTQHLCCPIPDLPTNVYTVISLLLESRKDDWVEDIKACHATKSKQSAQWNQLNAQAAIMLCKVYQLACRSSLDLRVSITGGVHFDLVKRVLRDINRSGQAPEEIIQQVSLHQHIW